MQTNLSAAMFTISYEVVLFLKKKRTPFSELQNIVGVQHKDMNQISLDI